MKRIPNLETAIRVCKELGLSFRYERAKKHLKFYLNNSNKPIIMSLNNDNPDRVSRDIKRFSP